MAKFLTETELEALIENRIIGDGIKENIEGIKYDFVLSNQILKAEFGRPVDYNKLTASEKSKINIEPGEVVFVLSQETVKLPFDICAILIPKRKLSHDGIMLMGGLSVDPGYEGRLLIGLYNFSSQPFKLMPGKKLIAANFFKLSEGEAPSKVYSGQSMLDFPDDLVRLMENYKPVSIQSIQSQMSKLGDEFDALRRDFKERDEWFNKFQHSLEGSENQIKSITSLLEQEIEQRKTKHGELSGYIEKVTTSVDNLTKDISRLQGVKEGKEKVWFWIFGVVGVVGALYGLYQYFNH